MAVLVIAMLMLLMTGRASSTWCVCNEMSDAVLQKTLDYACGAGADCGPIHSNGPCFQPNTLMLLIAISRGKAKLKAHVNLQGLLPSQRMIPVTMAVLTLPLAAGTSITATPTPVTTNPSTTMPSTTTTSSNTTPYTATPSNGVLGGLGNGTSPSGAGMNTDINDGGFRVPKTSMLFSITATLLISSPMILWH